MNHKRSVMKALRITKLWSIISLLEPSAIDPSLKLLNFDIYTPLYRPSNFKLEKSYGEITHGKTHMKDMIVQP